MSQIRFDISASNKPYFERAQKPEINKAKKISQNSNENENLHLSSMDRFNETLSAESLNSPKNHYKNADKLLLSEVMEKSLDSEGSMPKTVRIDSIKNQTNTPKHFFLKIIEDSTVELSNAQEKQKGLMEVKTQSTPKNSQRTSKQQAKPQFQHQTQPQSNTKTMLKPSNQSQLATQRQLNLNLQPQVQETTQSPRDTRPQPKSQSQSLPISQASSQPSSQVSTQFRWNSQIKTYRNEIQSHSPEKQLLKAKNAIINPVNKIAQESAVSNSTKVGLNIKIKMTDESAEKKKMEIMVSNLKQIQDEKYLNVPHVQNFNLKTSSKTIKNGNIKNNENPSMNFKQYINHISSNAQQRKEQMVVAEIEAFNGIQQELKKNSPIKVEKISFLSQRQPSPKCRTKPKVNIGNNEVQSAIISDTKILYEDNSMKGETSNKLLNYELNQVKIVKKSKEKNFDVKSQIILQQSPNVVKDSKPSYESLMQSLKIRQQKFDSGIRNMKIVDQEHYKESSPQHKFQQVNLQENEKKGQDITVWERNNLWLNAKNDKIERQFYNKCEDQLKQCTFQPNVIGQDGRLLQALISPKGIIRTKINLRTIDKDPNSSNASSDRSISKSRLRPNNLPDKQLSYLKLHEFKKNHDNVKDTSGNSYSSGFTPFNNK